MTPAQKNQVVEINEAHGIGALADGEEDLSLLSSILGWLQRGSHQAHAAFTRRIGEHG
jgi:hypothetical protein